MISEKWLTWFCAGAAFLLPWQTRLLYGDELLHGMHSEFGVLSVFAAEVAVVLCLAYALGARERIVESRRRILWLATLVGVATMLSAGLSEFSLLSAASAVHVLTALGFFAVLLLDRVNVSIVAAGFLAGLFVPLGIGFAQVIFDVSPTGSWIGMAPRHAVQLGDAVFTFGGTRVLRAYGTFSHPNVFGGYLGVALFVWLRFLPEWTSALSHVRRVLIGVVVTGVLFGGLLFTGSRSAILGVLIGLIVVFTARFVRTTQGRVLLGVGIIGMVGLSLGASLAFGHFAASLRGGGVHEERSLTERVTLYKEYGPFLQKTNLLTGRGVGTYVLSYAAFDPGKDVYAYQPVHNAWLLMLAEIGALGIIASIATLAPSAKRLFAQLSHGSARYTLGMATVLFTVAFFDHYLWSSWAGLALFALVFAFVVRVGDSGDLAV